MNGTRESILNGLKVLARVYPEQRIGQIIFNYVCANCPNNDPFFISDEDLLEVLEKVLEEISH